MAKPNRKHGTTIYFVLDSGVERMLAREILPSLTRFYNSRHCMDPKFYDSRHFKPKPILGLKASRGPPNLMTTQQYMKHILFNMDATLMTKRINLGLEIESIN